jgi:hypothetical protein
MLETRGFEGIGYHYADSNDDCLLVQQWIKYPSDLTGQSVSISKLLPRGVRCGVVKGGTNGAAPRGNSPPPVFKFRIIVEVEKIN